MSKSRENLYNLLNNLQFYLEDQTEGMVQSIQALVSSIRADDGMPIIRKHINDIATVVGNVVTSTETAMGQAGNSILRDRGESIIRKLSDCRAKLLEINSEGENIKDLAVLKDLTNKLPPLAFEIARETKVRFQTTCQAFRAGPDKQPLQELVRTVDDIDNEGRDADEDNFR
jgi:G protein-coupled receptor kinase-interacting protein 1 C term